MKRDIVVIGASAGGIEAVSRIIGFLPNQLDASVFVVIHIPRQYPSILPQILDRAGRLPAVHPSDRERFVHGKIYVAPPDRNMFLEKDRIRVMRSPTENMHRPSIDPLFRSAAFYHRARVIGVLLTGADSDGVSGLFTIGMRGGVTIVQDPTEAYAETMPLTASKHVPIHHKLSLKEIPATLMRLTDGANEEGDRHHAPS